MAEKERNDDETGKSEGKPGQGKRILLRTFGCQMNSYDSEVAEGILKAAGYKVIAENGHSEGGTLEGSEAGDPSAQKRPQDDGVSADIILMNTCSVREHAEERVFGRLGILGKLKENNPGLIVGLMGCMVEEHRERLFKRFPQLDLMVGTRNIKELPELIEQVRRHRRQVAKIKQDGISIEYTDQIRRQGKFHAWLPVMTGCDKVCTFCIVPITRGSEISMPACEICREAERLVGEGVKWITLLGQNVNSYCGESPVGASLVGAQNQMVWAGTRPAPTFPNLLDMLCKIPGLERISFTTSHPQDATEELFETIARNPKISRRFHLPLQSGSDRVLKRMKRLHTYDEYKEKVDLLRRLVPEISLTTDIIAGFSGESEEDHLATVRALEEIRFDDAYIYKYSLRPGTPAAKLPDDVPVAVKERRNAQLLALQRKISRENNERFVGKTAVVFAETLSPKDKKQLRGRTADEKKAVFTGSPSLLGSFQKVRFDEIRNETFLGTLA